jgi:hypothetical protein
MAMSECLRTIPSDCPEQFRPIFMLSDCPINFRTYCIIQKFHTPFISKFTSDQTDAVCSPSLVFIYLRDCEALRSSMSPHTASDKSKLAFLSKPTSYVDSDPSLPIPRVEPYLPLGPNSGTPANLVSRLSNSDIHHDLIIKASNNSFKAHKAILTV